MFYEKFMIYGVLCSLSFAWVLKINNLWIGRIEVILKGSILSIVSRLPVLKSWLVSVICWYVCYLLLNGWLLQSRHKEEDSLSLVCSTICTLAVLRVYVVRAGTPTPLPHLKLISTGSVGLVWSVIMLQWLCSYFPIRVLVFISSIRELLQFELYS